VFGPQLLGAYYQSVIVYYPVSVAYFFGGFTLYAFIAGGRHGVRTFWKNILPPAATALATGSSVAAIPLNLKAAQKTGVPRDISELIIPMGATIHMDGSCLSAILKIAFLFSVFNIPFTGLETYAMALGIALLSSLVMSGIPGGGFIAEVLIVSLYGFPPEAIPLLAVVGTLVDPPATLVNAAGDNVACMLVTRWVEGKNWMYRKLFVEINE
jgi:Na+/H+-dicarboxylate symporter